MRPAARLAERCPAESAGGVETFPGRIAHKLSILPGSLSAFLRPPAGAAGWQRPRRGAWEVCGNFSIPGATRAPGRSSSSPEFESRGTPCLEPWPAVVRCVPKGCLE